MNSREYYGQRLKAEVPTFLRVLRAVPSDKAAYRPDPRSSSAAGIGWLLASEMRDACTLIDRQELNYVESPPPADFEESIAEYERQAQALETKVATLDDAAWDGKAHFLVNGAVAWETTLGDMLWGFLFDAIHHRGQLSSYLRPMGAKVPAIYGPSADDPGA